PPSGQRIIAVGWQGVFRHALLEVMPVGELAENFSRELGAPTKELYSMAGLVFLANFFGWTAQEVAEAYIFRSDVQYALNLAPSATQRRWRISLVLAWSCFLARAWSQPSLRKLGMVQIVVLAAAKS